MADINSKFKAAKPKRTSACMRDKASISRISTRNAKTYNPTRRLWTSMPNHLHLNRKQYEILAEINHGTNTTKSLPTQKGIYIKVTTDIWCSFRQSDRRKICSAVSPLSTILLQPFLVSRHHLPWDLQAGRQLRAGPIEMNQCPKRHWTGPSKATTALDRGFKEYQESSSI